MFNWMLIWWNTAPESTQSILVPGLFGFRSSPNRNFRIIKSTTATREGLTTMGPQPQPQPQPRQDQPYHKTDQQRTLTARLGHTNQGSTVLTTHRTNSTWLSIDTGTASILWAKHSLLELSTSCLSSSVRYLSETALSLSLTSYTYIDKHDSGTQEPQIELVGSLILEMTSPKAFPSLLHNETFQFSGRWRSLWISFHNAMRFRGFY